MSANMDSSQELHSACYCWQGDSSLLGKKKAFCSAEGLGLLLQCLYHWETHLLSASNLQPFPSARYLLKKKDIGKLYERKVSLTFLP